MALSGKISILIITVVFSSQGIAQSLSGVVGMVNAGFMASRDVGDSIRFGTRYTLVGAEGYYRTGKAIISLSGHIGLQEAKPKGDKLLEPYLWTAHAGFGWLLTGKSRLCIYPAIGVGVNQLSITEHSQYTDTHNDIVTLTAPSTDLSLHFDYLILEPGSKSVIVNGIALGAKIGYNFCIVPPRQVQGWYFTISVGGLAFMRRDHVSVNK